MLAASTHFCVARFVCCSNTTGRIAITQRQHVAGSVACTEYQTEPRGIDVREYRTGSSGTMYNILYILSDESMIFQHLFVDIVHLNKNKTS